MTTDGLILEKGMELHRIESPFPLDSFKEAATHLRRPFTPAAVKFKVQATWPKENPTGGLVVAYIDARLAIERLNLIVPHLWHDEYTRVEGNQLLLCHLTVDGITRSDVGEGVGKGLYSDALKRAAVKFGVGVPLYATPQLMLNVGQGLKVGGRDKVTLTDEGVNRARANYTGWLERHGIKAFGEPLDHGDVLGAQGDAEVEADAPPPEPAQPKVATITKDDAAEITALLDGLSNKDITTAFNSVGLDARRPLKEVPVASLQGLLAAVGKARGTA